MSSDISGKAYDFKLIKRLLKYTKSYWKLLLLSIFLLVIITGLELLNPYLIKVTIDDYINSNNKPIIEAELNSNFNGIQFQGKEYIRKSAIEKDKLADFDNYPVKRILKEGNNYYLVPILSEDASTGILLDEETYNNFRAIDIKGIRNIGILFFWVILFTFIFSLITITIGYILGNSYLSKMFGKYASLVSGIIVIALGLYEILMWYVHKLG